MKTKSSPRGDSTSKAEVVQVSDHGFWLIVNGREYFLAYDRFPWFRTAKRSQIRDVTLHGDSHLYWHELDIDLSLDIIEQPDKYPLVYR